MHAAVRRLQPIRRVMTSERAAALWSRGDPHVGRLLAGKYEVERRIGDGGMGRVYRARHRMLDKRVAVKVLAAEHEGDPRFADRFRREALAASRLDHPNVVQVFDFGIDGTTPYLAMELVEGGSLAERMNCGPLPLGESMTIVAEVLAALAVAHDRGVLHRDVKPENVLFAWRVDDEGHPRPIAKVCDFGLAFFADLPAGIDGPRLTAAGRVVGTPEYMSPEAIRGEPLDARTDVYACGVLLFELCTGQVPFQDDDATRMLLRRSMEPPPVPSSLRGDLPQEIDALVLRAIHLDREERFATARDFRAALLACTPVDRPAGVRRSRERVTSRVLARARAHGVPIASLVLALLVVVAGLATASADDPTRAQAISGPPLPARSTRVAPEARESMTGSQASFQPRSSSRPVTERPSAGRRRISAVPVRPSGAPVASFFAVRAGEGVRARAVRTSVERERSAFERCYAVARWGGVTPSRAVDVTLVLDGSGRARDVRVGGARPAALGRCIGRAASRIRTRAPEVETVAASFGMVFASVPRR